MTDRDAVASLSVLALCGMVIFILMWWTTPATPETVCLTKKEARQLWPRRHIYWYSSHHCWSNRRGPPRGIKMDPVDPVFPPKVLAKEPEAASADNDHCCWPLLDTDASGNVAEPPLTWKERWYEFPTVFNTVARADR